MIFSLSEDFNEREKILSFQPEKAGYLTIEKTASKAKFERQRQQRKYKSIERTITDICRRSGYHLRAAKFISGRILMVISSQSNAKTKFSSVMSRIDLQSLYTEILSNTRELKKLEKFYCLWKIRQIELGIDCVKKGKSNLEFDINR